MSEEKDQEKQMTEEEMKAAAEKRKIDWDNFNKKLKDSPTDTVTNEVLFKAIEFISEDMDGIVQMVHVLAHNMNILGHNFNQVMQMLQKSQAGISANKTKSGIILP